MKICVSVVERDADAAAEAVALAERSGADLAEVRFDLMAELPRDLSRFRSAKIPLIATLRAKAEGGGYEGNDKAKLEFLRTALRSGFGIVDVELASPLMERRDRELRGAGVICSHHDLSGTPSVPSMVELLVRGAAKDAMPKVAVTVNGCRDLLAIADAARLFTATEKEFVLIGMGELGALTRACADRLGSAFTYASLEKGKEAAPGQIDLATMRRLTPDRKVVGVIGDPVAHSLSPQMHEAAFLETGVPGAYLKIRVRRDELEDFVQVALDYGLRGFNVTIPHKESLAGLVDRLSPSAQKVGAVNTVSIDEGELVGHNTDYFGVEMTFFENGVEPSGKRAIVVGAGGAARACCAYLSASGAKTSVLNRTRARAEELARSFGDCRAVDLASAGKEAYDIVINCTPVGMAGFSEALSVPAQLLRPGQFVFDLVYNPPQTPLLREAERLGARTANGERMLVHQARKAFDIWCGRLPSYEVMAAALRGASP